MTPSPSPPKTWTQIQADENLAHAGYLGADKILSAVPGTMTASHEIQKGLAGLLHFYSPAYKLAVAMVAGVLIGMFLMGAILLDPAKAAPSGTGGWIPILLLGISLGAKLAGFVHARSRQCDASPKLNVPQGTPCLDEHQCREDEPREGEDLLCTYTARARRPIKFARQLVMVVTFIASVAIFVSDDRARYLDPVTDAKLGYYYFTAGFAVSYGFWWLLV